MKILIAAEWIEVQSTDEYTEHQIRQCVEDRGVRDVTGEQLYLVDQAARTVAINMNIIEAEDGIRSLKSDYTDFLQAAGYAHLTNTKPHIAINRILKILKPHQLYTRMIVIMMWKLSENFYKKTSIGSCSRCVSSEGTVNETKSCYLAYQRWRQGKHLNHEKSNAPQ